MMLARGDQRDLGANESAVGAVEGEQGLAAEVEAVAAVGADELLGGPPLSEGLEVHGEKGEIAGDVGVSEGGIELDSVHDANRSDCQHVLAAQVAVPVANEPGAPATLDLLCVERHERVAEAERHIERPPDPLLPSDGRELAQVPLPHLQDLARTGPVHLWRPAVKVGQATCHRLELLAPQRAGRDQPGERV